QLSWKGNVESVARPALGDGWQLHLRDLDSHVYDAAWRRTMVASRLWDVVKGRLESELSGFAFDLAPPVEEAQGLIRASVEPARARPVLEALATLHPLGVEVDDEGVKVQVAQDRLLRYASFVAAGDALAALDAAAPSLGLEISGDGLRRLARVLDPTYVGDPLAYTEAPDPVLRELFHFHEPAPSESTPAPPPADESSWLGPRTAWAAPPPDELGTIARRLDRWLPRPDELTAYRDAVGRLLALVAGRTVGANAVEDRFARLYGVLVPAVAWQESGGRQF